MLKEESSYISQETILLIVYSVVIVLSLLGFVIWFFILYQKRKDKFLKDRAEAKRKFEEQIASSRVEIQEQTLKNIAWELHDNVGQLLSVINIQLNILLHKAPESCHKQLTETKDLVTKTVQEVRSLSKTLNTDVIKQNGLVDSIKVEIERFNRLKILEAELILSGTQQTINSNDEIILFRIIQEFLSNVIKHAKAGSLVVSLDYKENVLEIHASDNGVGFDVAEKHHSSGMQTMKERSKLLGATYQLDSEKGKGTRLFIKYPYKNGN